MLLAASHEGGGSQDRGNPSPVQLAIRGAQRCLKDGKAAWPPSMGASLGIWKELMSFVENFPTYPQFYQVP